MTFQDHPYQPAYLDTWTLLSYVAANTSAIHLAANVSNLPLRPPAVLARSVASLDLLSGGRIELGLGAGGFWDTIEAMGGRRLSSGQSVQALAEALAIIRAIWDADERGGVRVDGEFHRAHGAKRGPAPTHDVQVWVGAIKPRMLGLVGRSADGWLPSLAYVPPEDFAASNAVIDEAAESAGRSPSAVRRLLNVGGRFSPTGSGLLQGPDINTMTMRQNKWTLGTYCESYCRIVTTHHTLEDAALFPRLRAGDRRLGPVVDRLEQEHRTIHDVLEGVDRTLVGFVSVPDGMSQLRASVDLLSDALLSHLSHEERELVEPLARLGIQ